MASMDWNNEGYRLASLGSRPETSFGFLCNYNYDHPFPGLEMKPQSLSATQILPSLTGKSVGFSNTYGQDLKKKRLSTEQLESLENCFQEEVKLDPDRKMKLAKELGMQPRQIAIWFQNRRARWKAKQLENLYDALKQELEAVTGEKQQLQQEVMALRALLKDQVGKKTQLSPGEETVESRSIVNPEGDAPPLTNDGNYIMNVDDYSNPAAIMTPYNWPALL